MKKTKKPLIISIAVAAVLVLAFFILIRPEINYYLGKSELKNGNDSAACELLNKNHGTFMWEKSKTALENAEIAYIGGTYEYGRYSQDGDGSSEPLVWDVLDVKSGKLLLISDCVLDCEPYEKRTDLVKMKNAGTEIVTWQSCNIREILNSAFITDAFTVNEAEQIAITDVTTNYKKHSKDAENQYNYVDKTEDKIFILSAAEAEKYMDEDQAKAVATSVCMSKGVKYNATSSFATYWLRSPGFDQDYAAYMNYDGKTINGTSAASSCTMTNDTTGVRPAMWLYMDEATDTE